MPIQEWETKAGDRFQLVPIALIRGDGSARDISGDGLSPNNIFINLQDTNDASIRLIGNQVTQITTENPAVLGWRPTEDAVKTIDNQQRRWEMEVEIRHPGAEGYRETFPVRDEDKMFLVVNPDIGNA